MSLERTVFELAATVGQAQRLLTAYEAVTGDLPGDQSLSVSDEIRAHHLPESEREGYVLLPLIPGYRTLALRFCVLGHAFRARGYEPLVLRDDANLPIRPELTVDNERKVLSVEGCRYRARRYPELFGIETVSIGEALDGSSERPTVGDLDETELRSVTYRGVDVSSCAMASTRKYLKEYSFDLTDPEPRRVFEDCLRGAMMIADSTRELIDSYDIEVALVNEAHYIQGRVPLDLCESAGVNVYSQKNGYHRGKIMFGTPANRDYMGQFADEDLTASAVDTTLSNRQRERIESLMEKRRSGTVTPYKYTTDNESSVDTERDKLVGIFSNILWDGALEPEQSLYRDVREWFDDTVEAAARNADTQFVIKAHPGEAKRNTNEGLADWVEEDYTPLPENVDFLPPDTEVNTYALIDDLDAGIVYASTVGLEMALDGVPVLVGGYPPYHGFGITHDPASKSEYVAQIRNVGALEHSAERKRRAWRFAYFLFVCKHLEFPPLADPEGDVRLTHEDIVSDDGVYTSMVDQILAREEVIQPGCLGLK